MDAVFGSVRIPVDAMRQVHGEDDLEWHFDTDLTPNQLAAIRHVAGRHITDRQLELLRLVVQDTSEVLGLGYNTSHAADLTPRQLDMIRRIVADREGKLGFIRYCDWKHSIEEVPIKPQVQLKVNLQPTTFTTERPLEPVYQNDAGQIVPVTKRRMVRKVAAILITNGSPGSQDLGSWDLRRLAENTPDGIEVLSNDTVIGRASKFRYDDDRHQLLADVLIETDLPVPAKPLFSTTFVRPEMYITHLGLAQPDAKLYGVNNDGSYTQDRMTVEEFSRRNPDYVADLRNWISVGAEPCKTTVRKNLAYAEVGDFDSPWCEDCRSFHPTPRDEAHWKALRCFKPYEPEADTPTVQPAPVKFREFL